MARDQSQFHIVDSGASGPVHLLDVVAHTPPVTHAAETARIIAEQVSRHGGALN